ncbi:MAG: diguanylate cyclase [Nitrosomonas sp.]|nr:diguanylate cyclase [Nitrosomonas sp.]
MRKSIQKLHPSDLDVTASFGIVEIQQDSSEGFTELFKAANEATDQAKSNGGNQVIARYL